MIKILKFAKKSWYIILAIILLLFIQANCELALPEYTSNIVDVGIQYRGIENSVPDVIRRTSMENLSLFLTEEQKQTVLAEYTLLDKTKIKEEEYQKYQKAYPKLSEENLYILNDTGLKKEEKEAQIEKLKEILAPAETIYLLFTSQGEQAEQMRKQILGAMQIEENTEIDFFTLLSSLPKENLIQMKENIVKEMTVSSDTMLESMAISFLQEEYQNIGIALDKVQMNYLRNVGGRMIALALLTMVAAILVGYLSAKLAARTSRDLRNQVFQKVVGFSSEEMNRFSTASLITRSTNDIQQVQQVLVMLFRIVAYAPIMGIGGIIKVFHTNASMTWIIAVAVGVIMFMVMILMQVAMPKFKSMQKLVDRLNLVSREILTGIPVIRAFSREKHEEKRFDSASRDLMKTQLFTTRTMSFMMPAMMFIMNAITVLILWVGSHGIDLGQLQVGDMMAFITYTMQIVMSFLMLTMISVMLPRASVAADRIDEILKSETVIHNPEDPKKDVIQKGEVRFENVSFQYPGAEECALTDIDFTAKSGETTAIIGSTGCGKSTLVQLIPRLFDVTKGKITIDGVDIRQMDMKELRRKIGYVPQKGILFSGTIASNLKFGAPDISNEKMEEAAAIAQATEFIETKPEGYETGIAQGGTNVSGGQKQRLSIARAIAKNPNIYVFDDSFSALDYKTDITLRKALKEKVSEATVLIVAQRISTIIHAEKIIVLEDGKIVGMGTHEELMEDNKVYQQIAMSQLSKGELEKKGKVSERSES